MPDILVRDFGIIDDLFYEIVSDQWMEQTYKLQRWFTLKEEDSRYVITWVFEPRIYLQGGDAASKIEYVSKTNPPLFIEKALLLLRNRR